ncbi:hypothetical protein SUGI_1170270 [Cryptomeria japonica]|nr:hypothetical protein SUGI_1170270 [Cryptomeria japonica]
MGVLFGFLRLLMLCIVSWCNITVASSGPVKLGPSSNVSKNLYFPDFRLNSKAYNDIKLLGSASLAEDLGIIQIPAPPTDPEANISFQAGRAIFSSPVRLFDPTTTTPASFHTTFSFQIDRTATSKSGSDANGQGGSGLTFILVPDEVTVGRPGPWLGMLNDACEEDYKTFAVEFDTYRNEEFGDPNDNHVGINLGSIVSNTTIDAADADVSFKNGSVVRAWINYDGNRKWIDLSLGKEKDDKPSKTVYAAPLDLSSFLTEYMFVGFSASTGRFTQIHNILSWNFSSTSKAYLRVPTENACERKLFLWGRSHRKPPSAFLIFVAVVVLCLIALLSLYCNRKPPEKLKTAASALPGKKQRPRPPHKPRRFSMSELSLATRSFSEGEILGYGERGIFFKGTLQNGSPVAIKRFSPPVILHANLDRRKILKEIGTLSRLRHPNLAPIRAVLGDFGLIHSSKNCQDTSSNGKSLVSALDEVDHEQNLRAPESSYLEIPNEKIDVFGFGVIVLEILSGRRSLDQNRPKQEVDLVAWAWNLQENEKLIQLVDRRLGVTYNPEQAICLSIIGLLCTLDDPRMRPSMEEVIWYINGEKPLPTLPSRRPTTCFLYPSATELCNLYSCSPRKKISLFGSSRK